MNGSSDLRARPAEKFRAINRKKAHKNANTCFMRRFVLLFASISTLGAVGFGQNYAGAIVYGPKAAFNITAPEGWVLDNQSGKSQGLPCVLYRKGQSWA